MAAVDRGGEENAKEVASQGGTGATETRTACERQATRHRRMHSGVGGANEGKAGAKKT